MDVLKTIYFFGMLNTSNRITKSKKKLYHTTGWVHMTLGTVSQIVGNFKTAIF